MRSSQTQFCEDVGFLSPACEPRENFFNINNYELGFNEQMETLPASYYDPQLNPYVRSIPAVQNNYTPLPQGATDVKNVPSIGLPPQESFSLSNFIQTNPGLSLAITLGAGYLILKAVK